MRHSFNAIIMACEVALRIDSVNVNAIRRTFDATLLNDVANDPQVRPWLLGEGVIDLTEVVGNPANFALVTEQGGFVMIAAGSGDYEAHSIFRRKSGLAYDAMIASFDYMFTRTDCLRMTTKLPDANIHARNLALLGGFEVLFRNEITQTDCADYSIDRWAVNTNYLADDGEAFHRAIDEACPYLPAHPIDEVHDLAVGATMRMARAGQSVKGAWFYNRWASLAGYPGIKLLSAQPFVFDTGRGAIVEMFENKPKVLSCL